MEIEYTDYEREHYYENIDNIVNKIDELIIQEMFHNCYDTDDLQLIVCKLIMNHGFTSKDTIQNLIYELENIIEEMRK